MTDAAGGGGPVGLATPGSRGWLRTLALVLLALAAMATSGELHRQQELRRTTAEVTVGRVVEVEAPDPGDSPRIGRVTVEVRTPTGEVRTGRSRVDVDEVGQLPAVGDLVDVDVPRDGGAPVLWGGEARTSWRTVLGGVLGGGVGPLLLLGALFGAWVERLVLSVGRTPTIGRTLARLVAALVLAGAAGGAVSAWHGRLARGAEPTSAEVVAAYRDRFDGDVRVALTDPADPRRDRHLFLEVEPRPRVGEVLDVRLAPFDLVLDADGAELRQPDDPFSFVGYGVVGSALLLGFVQVVLLGRALRAGFRERRRRRPARSRVRRGRIDRRQRRLAHGVAGPRRRRRRG